jgi:phospholipid-transporting ATPase
MNTVMLDEDMLLLRGSSLRNTDWVYGVAVYTGHETKVMMNSMQSRAKLSKLEIAANKYIIYGLVAQACLCAMAAVYSTTWMALIRGTKYEPLYLGIEKYTVFSALREIGSMYGRWVLALCNIVSVSLLVTLEMVKFTQGTFLEWDWMIYD